MKVIFAYVIAFASLAALLAGPPGPHGWSQSRVETKAPEPKWIPLTVATNELSGEWPNNNWDSLIYKPKEPKEYPILCVLRTYSTNIIGHTMIRNPHPVYENGFKISLDWIDGPTTTNVATMLVIGYFDGDLSKPIELMEAEKPQKKAP